MAADPENEKYYLEREQLTVDSDDEFQYEEVPVDEDFVAQGPGYCMKRPCSLRSPSGVTPKSKKRLFETPRKTASKTPVKVRTTVEIGTQTTIQKDFNVKGLNIIHDLGLSVSATSVRNKKKMLMEVQQQKVGNLIDGFKERATSTIEIIGDNLDISIAPKVMSIDKQRKSLHWFLTMVKQRRVTYEDLNIQGPPPAQESIMNILSYNYIPSLEQMQSVKKNFVFHISQVLLKYIKFIQEANIHYPEYITHPFMEKTKKKSTVLNCDLIDESENSNTGMITILEKVHEMVVPHLNNDISQKVVFGGDVLTNIRAFTAQEAMQNNDTPFDCVLGIIHRPEGLHRQFNFLSVMDVEEVLVHSSYLEEDLDLAVRTIREAKEDEQATARKEVTHKAKVTKHPEVVDDFVRNFLVRMGMERTLDCFQTEWYELQQRGFLHEEDVGVVPDIYTRNQNLDSEIKFLKAEVEKYKDAALKAKDLYVKLRKERDYHRMHHKRVVQEKNKLITDIKRLKRHYAQYEPTLQQLKKKYEVAMKEKMLSKLERDRAMGQVTGLQSTLKSMESFKGGSVKLADQSMTGSSNRICQRGGVSLDAEGKGPTQRALQEARESVDVQELPKDYKRHPKDSEFPPDKGVNPYLGMVKAPSGHLARSGGFRLSNTFQAHSHPISGLALHPRKQILATSSDDNTWKMWAVPGGDIIMTGEGHTDWVSECDFHPSGTKLATSSGDTTVKIWDFSKAECVHTFTDHTHAVWCVSWHSCGDFLASCSMDNTAKVWDLNSVRCRYTLRGHTDSVNSIEFLPFSNTLLTCSADKTLSLWDARTGLCAQTFYGHLHSVNFATFNLKGDTVASCDSYGTVKLWDVRQGAPMVSVDCGPHPANRVAFDPSGQVLAVASNDSTIKMYEMSNGRISTLVGHEDAVQCLIFDRSGEYMVSGGSDCTIRIWS